MKIGTLAVLGIAAVAAAGAAVYVAQRGSVSEDSAIGEVMFQSLSPRISDVAMIHIKRGDGEFSLRRAEHGWELVEKGGFPARFDRVQETVVGLAQLRRQEAMTSRPERYAQIGVQDPSQAEAGELAGTGPTLLTLKDDKGEVLASAIIGNTRFGARPGVYIRQPGEAQSWLAEGRLEVPAHFTQWIEPQILSIQRDRIQSVAVTPPEGEPFSLERRDREQTAFEVIGIPPGSELKSPTASEAFGNALAFLSLEDVAPAESIAFTGKEGAALGSQLEFRTFDGLLLLVQLADHEGVTWMRLHAMPDPDKAEAAAAVIEEAMALNARTDRWAFAIPSYKASVMKTTMADLIIGGRPFEMPPSMMGEDIQVIPMGAPENAPPLPFADPPPQPPGG